MKCWPIFNYITPRPLSTPHSINNVPCVCSWELSSAPRHWPGWMRPPRWTFPISSCRASLQNQKYPLVAQQAAMGNHHLRKVNHLHHARKQRSFWFVGKFDSLNQLWTTSLDNDLVIAQALFGQIHALLHWHPDVAGSVAKVSAKSRSCGPKCNGSSSNFLPG